MTGRGVRHQGRGGPQSGADRTIVYPLVQRLSRGEWFTSRTSSCALYAPVYDKVSTTIQDDLRRAFASLSADDTPMVRRAAAKWLAVRPIQYLLGELRDTDEA